MKLRVLGCDGGRGLGYNSTTLMFNNHVLIDAGTIQSEITLEEALKVTDIFFTHSHLDHLLDLPFLIDATFEQRRQPLRLHGTKETLDDLMTHIFNDKIWPNFSRLPTQESGQFTLHYIEVGKTYTVGDLSFIPIPVNHTVPTVGYKVSDANGALVFSGDTGPVDSIWQVANETDNLEAMILDLSFPISEQYIADLSKHMTADDVEGQLKKLKKDCDIYVFHYKVGLASIIEGQTKQLKHFGKPIKTLRNYKEIII
ncbi:MAG: ribonuclease BN (tRNA processing enzyme) [Alphaproteobacteria bacterium]|jgi:ribonuclease BN (tRNA processing enzyme)